MAGRLHNRQRNTDRAFRKLSSAHADVKQAALYPYHGTARAFNRKAVDSGTLIGLPNTCGRAASSDVSIELQYLGFKLQASVNCTPSQVIPSLEMRWTTKQPLKIFLLAPQKFALGLFWTSDPLHLLQNCRSVQHCVCSCQSHCPTLRAAGDVASSLHQQWVLI